MIQSWIDSNKIKNQIFIPKYYDPILKDDINSLSSTHHLLEISKLLSEKKLSYNTGDEIGLTGHPAIGMATMAKMIGNGIGKGSEIK